jgi:uncharacterized protein
MICGELPYAREGTHPIESAAGDRHPARMPVLIAAALAGLIATPHCAAMCGGFASACSRPHAPRAGSRAISHAGSRGGLAAWHAGRMFTYAGLGAIAGSFGRVLPGPTWLPALISALLLTWFAASLAGLVPAPTARVPGAARAGTWLVRREGSAARFLFGTVTGLLPCGMVYAALSLAVVAAQPLAGAAAMLAFGAATVPGLTVLSVGVQRLALRGLWHRRALAALVLSLGLWSVSMRALGGSAHAAHSNLPASLDHATSSDHATPSDHAPSSDHAPIPEPSH